MVQYTVAVANYNMADTLERSLRSINGLIDDRFEILVVDDGSTDGSLEILNSLEAELNRLRVVVDDNDNLAEARRASVEYARGEYVLIQLDTDDEYLRGITDFVEIFEQLDEQVDFDPFLKGYHIQMGSRELLQEVSHRSIGYHEDRDLWRRMIVAGNLVGLHHRGIRRSIGYDRSLPEKAQVRFDAIVTQLRSGITFRSYLRWLLGKLVGWRPNTSLSLASILFNLVFVFPAYLVARQRGIYTDLPDNFNDMTIYTKILESHIMTLSGIEREYDVDFDRSALSEEGRQIYCLAPGERKGPRYWLNEHADIAANRETVQWAHQDFHSGETT